MATILIADDDPNSRLLVSTVLAHRGDRVIEAATGGQALERARSSNPDLMLLDLSLPDMNGAEVMRALRRDTQTASLKVSLYTASAVDAMLRQFMEIYGIADAIPKPSEPSEFMAAVDRALSGR
jgi:CheY-like chemotaxis protein